MFVPQLNASGPDISLMDWLIASIVTGIDFLLPGMFALLVDSQLNVFVLISICTEAVLGH